MNTPIRSERRKNSRSAVRRRRWWALTPARKKAAVTSEAARTCPKAVSAAGLASTAAASVSRSVPPESSAPTGFCMKPLATSTQ